VTPRPRRRHRLATALLAAGLALALVAPAAACPRASLPAIENEVMCPVCGTSLAVADAPQAERQRVFIRDMIDDCASSQEIKDALVAEFGTRVLASPEPRGFDLAAFAVPIGGGLLAAAGVGAGALRWRRRARARAPGEGGILGGRAGTGPPIPGGEPVAPSRDEERRLERDLARYDL
jgi:cytochrome c-type biogenesis protein CcmH